MNVYWFGGFLEDVVSKGKFVEGTNMESFHIKEFNLARIIIS